MKIKNFIFSILLFSILASADLESLIPKEANIMISWKGTKSWQSNAQWQQLFQHPEIKDAMQMGEEIVKSIMAKIPQPPSDNPYTMQDFCKLFEGEMAIAVYIGAIKPGVVVLFEKGQDTQSHIKALLDKAPAKIPSEPFTLNNLTGEKIGAKSDAVYTLLHNNRFYVASGLDILTNTIELKSPLINEENYQKLQEMTKTTDNALFKAYFNLASMWKMAPPGEQKNIQKMGLGNWQGVMVNITHGEKFTGHIALLVPGEKKGITKLLDLSGGDSQKLLSLTPGQANSLTYFYCDYYSYFQETRDFLEAYGEYSKSEMEKDLEKFNKETGFHFAKDILYPFSGEVLSISPAAKELEGSTFVMLGLRDSQKFRSTLDRFLQLGFVEEKVLEHKGQKIYSFVSPLQNLMENIQDPGQFEPSPNSLVQIVAYYYFGINICFIVEDDVIVMSDLVQKLRDYIDYRQAYPNEKSTQYIPKEAAFFHWEEGVKTNTYRYNTILPLLSFVEGMVREVGVPLDISRMPKVSAVRPFFGSSDIQYGTHPDGLILSTRTKSSIPSLSGATTVAAVGIIAAIAIPGLIRVRISANETSAISNLRSLDTGQNQFLSSTHLDQDGDGMGEYGFLQELSGAVAPRGQEKPVELGYTYLKADQDGIATKSGYHFRIYLPTDEGNVGETVPLPQTSAESANRRETRYVIYAWPVDYGSSGMRAFVINQRAEVYYCDNNTAMYSGRDNMPAGDAAFDSRNKGAKNLEGDFSEDHANDQERWRPMY